jgi:hypothetical protein
MLLSEILDQLARGELSTLANEYDEHESGAMDYGSYDTVIPHINMALTALHSRFPLMSGKLFVQQFESVSDYTLIPANGTAANYEGAYQVDANHYIVDSLADPFVGGILKIERVVDELGEPLTLNKSGDPYSLWLPQFNTLTVPFPSDDKAMVVHYRKNHPKIVNDNLDASTNEVVLPYTYMQCLLLFVAARVHASVPSLEGTNNGAMYEAKYERACMEIENKGIVQKEEAPETKFSSRGFV